MAIRKIIQIDEDKCNGCGLCIPNCAEGAIQIIDGKAKMLGDHLCDGLGACLGHCPEDALSIIERDADDFDEEAVEEHLKNLNSKTAHKEVPQKQVHQGCPGSRVMAINNTKANEQTTAVSNDDIEIKIKSQLRQWPVQFMLVPAQAPYFDEADLLITADCVPFAYPNYHLDLLKGKRVLIGCPKLDNAPYYLDKLTEILKLNDIKSLTVNHMEVPCCSGIVQIAKAALAASGKNIPFNAIQVGIDGTIQQDLKS